MWLALGEYRGPRTATAFLRYAEARVLMRAREELFRAYLCDAVTYAAQGQYMTVRYSEASHPAPKETRTGREIAEYMKDRIRRTGGATDEPA